MAKSVDMTSGEEWKIILAFSLPIMGANLLQVAYSFVDSAIVGSVAGPSALGAIGVVGSMIWFLTAICTALGNGVNIAAAQFIGAQRRKTVREIASSAYVAALILAAVLFLICLVIADPMIRGFLQTPPEMQSDAKAYFLIYGAGVIFTLLYNVTYGLLRAHGDSGGALIFLLISAVLNVVLDLFFVMTLHLGVIGAAAATVISQAGSAAASILYLVRRIPSAIPGRSEWKCWPGRCRMLTSLSVPIAMQSAVNSVCFIILQRLINSFGVHSIEGYAAMLKVEQFVHIPSNSLHTALSSFTGQNIGAGRPDRARRGWRLTAMIGVASCLVISMAVLLADVPLLSIFGITGESLLRGKTHLDLLMFFIWVSTITNITNGFLQGAGDVKIPAVSTLVNLSIRLSLSFALALIPAIGWRCYFVSMPPAWICACLLVTMRYRSGRWERYKLN